MGTETYNDTYFEYLMSFIDMAPYIDIPGIRSILWQLHGIDFYPVFPMDKNRAYDGLFLRDIYAKQINVDRGLINRYLDLSTCTILELMIGLAYRCESQIMDTPELGDRTYVWFWEMFDNLGLFDCVHAGLVDHNLVNQKIMIFLNRQYEPNGRGGLFSTNDLQCDMRKLEIWQQMMKYLVETQ